MSQYSLVVFVILLFAVTFSTNGDDIKKKKQYALLIEEGKKSRIADILSDANPDNLEQKLLYVRIQSSKEIEDEFYYFQNKISFIDQTDLYPSLENLIKVGFSTNQYNKNAQVIALRLLSSHQTKTEKNKPSMQQIENFLKSCKDMEIVIEGVPLLTRLDKEKGFIFADNINANKKVTLKDKMNLSCRLMPYEYTGGYTILQELAKSTDVIIKLNTPMLLNYYEQYNGNKATNTKIIIDTSKIIVNK